MAYTVYYYHSDQSTDYCLRLQRHKRVVNISAIELGTRESITTDAQGPRNDNCNVARLKDNVEISM